MSYPQYPSGPQQPPHGPPPQGPPGGQPPYGPPPGGQPPYGDDTGGQPPFGGGTGGQPPYGGMPPGPPGGPPPYGPPPGGQPPKKGMSTGAKVGIGVGGGCLLLIVIAVVVVVIIASMAGGDDEVAGTIPPSSSTQEEGTQGGENQAPAQEGVSMTATAAGTAGDVIDDTVYTVLDIEFTNNSQEPLNINPMYFTMVLADGTETTDWSMFADIQQFEAGTLAPGSSLSGQVAVQGEVTVTEVRYDPTFGLEDPIVATVQ